MNFQHHIILHSVDTPLRIVFWTKAEAALILLPLLIGGALGFFLVGVVMSGINVSLMRVYKKNFGKGRLRAVLYWFFPHSRSRYPALPPSYRRHYVG
jgi:conjugal transfer pilus assembly protein TraL